jgi:hypothetical protein
MPVNPMVFAGPNIGQLYNDARNQRVQIEGQQQDRQLRVGELMQRKEEHAAAERFKGADRHAEVLSRMAAGVRQVPYEQRRALLQQLAPQLQQMGVSMEEIATFDPSDQQLDAYIALGGQQQRPPSVPADIQEYEYAKRQGYQGTYMDFAKEQGPPIMVDNGDGTKTLYPRNMLGGGGRPQSAPRPVSSKAEYDALPPGSEYIAPDGSRRRKGGQTPQASGGFRP